MTKVLSAAGVALLATATQVLAQSKPPVGVPEIDALAGVAAIAAIGAVVVLIRERSKH